MTHESERTEVGHRGGPTRSSEEVPVVGRERRDWIVQLYLIDQTEVGGIIWIEQSRLYGWTIGAG